MEVPIYAVTFNIVRHNTFKGDASVTCYCTLPYLKRLCTSEDYKALSQKFEASWSKHSAHGRICVMSIKYLSTETVDNDFDISKLIKIEFLT